MTASQVNCNSKSDGCINQAKAPSTQQLLHDINNLLCMLMLPLDHALQTCVVDADSTAKRGTHSCCQTAVCCHQSGHAC